MASICVNPWWGWNRSWEFGIRNRSSGAFVGRVPDGSRGRSPPHRKWKVQISKRALFVKIRGSCSLFACQRPLLGCKWPLFEGKSALFDRQERLFGCKCLLFECKWPLLDCQSPLFTCKGRLRDGRWPLGDRKWRLFRCKRALLDCRWPSRGLKRFGPPFQGSIIFGR